VTLTTYSDVIGYKRLRGLGYLHLQEAAWSSEMLVSCHIIMQYHSPEGCVFNKREVDVISESIHLDIYDAYAYMSL
jgi:hypothetical protein